MAHDLTELTLRQAFDGKVGTDSPVARTKGSAHGFRFFSQLSLVALDPGEAFAFGHLGH